MNSPTVRLGQYHKFRTEEAQVGLVALTCFVLIAFYMAAMGHAFVRGDAVHYWQMSLRLDSIFDPMFQPGYPALIFIVRQLTVGVLSARAIMLGICGVSFVMGSILFYRILSMLAPAEAFKGTLAFILFPFVGVTAAVDPRADALAITFFLASLLFMLKGQAWRFCLTALLGLLTHKALWPFIFLLAVVAWVQGKLKWYHVLALALPLAAIFAAGALYHRDALWMFSTHVEVVVSPRGNWPLFDGIAGTFQEGGLKNVVKTSLAVGLLAISIFLSYQAIRARQWFMLAMAIPIAFWCVALNRFELWAAVRFGKLIVLPLLVVPSSFLTWWRWLAPKRRFFYGALFLLAISQFVFAWNLKLWFP